MKMVKYNTKHLICLLQGDLFKGVNYLIFEKKKQDKPIAIYINKETMYLSEDFPKPEKKYKYFKELCEVIEFLYSMED